MIIGHQLTTGALQKALKQDKIHNAYLFVGKNGIGKRTLARWFAEQLLYAPRQRRLPLDGHPDFYTLAPLEATGKRETVKLAAVQSLISYLRQQPLMSHRNVILIDQADALTNSAANALLKTLEEPRKAVLLLTTEDLEAVPVTVRSRCQVYYLEPLSASECQTVLNPFVVDVPPAIVALAPGQPGAVLEHCRLVNALEPVRAALSAGFQAPHSCLALAKELKLLTTRHQQLWLLQWWQRSLVEQSQSYLLMCDQAIKQLGQNVQPELVWDVLLCQLSAAGINSLDLPAPVALLERPTAKAIVETETPSSAKSRQTRRSSGTKTQRTGRPTNPATEAGTAVTPPTAAPSSTGGIQQRSLFTKRPTGSS